MQAGSLPVCSLRRLRELDESYPTATDPSRPSGLGVGPELSRVARQKSASSFPSCGLTASSTSRRPPRRATKATTRVSSVMPVPRGRARSMIPHLAKCGIMGRAAARVPARSAARRGGPRGGGRPTQGLIGGRCRQGEPPA